MRHDPVQPGKGLVTELRPARRAEAPRDRVKSSLGGGGRGTERGGVGRKHRSGDAERAY